MTDNVVRAYTDFTGGTVDCLDYLAGTQWAHGDMGIVKKDGEVWIYNADTGSGATADSPRVIAPATTPGNVRLILQAVCGYEERTEFIPIEHAIDGASAPDAAATFTSGVGKVRARTFAGDSSEDVIINWKVPEDCYISDGIKYKVLGVVTAATGPSAEGIVFSLAGCCIGSGDALGVTYGTEVLSMATALTEAQYDLVFTAQSTKVTVTDLTAGELALLKLYRDHDHASDTYVQLFGVIGIMLTYTVMVRKAA